MYDFGSSGYRFESYRGHLIIKELGYKELIKSEKKVVKQVFRVFYEPCDFRDANVELVEKKGGNADVKKHLYTITCRGSNYSMTAPPTAPDYSF